MSVPVFIVPLTFVVGVILGALSERADQKAGRRQEGATDE